MLRTEYMRVDPAYRERLRVCGLDTVAKVLNRVNGRVVAWSRTTDTLFVPTPDGAPGFYLKRYHFPSWTKRLRGTFRGTFFGEHRAQLEFQSLHRMRAVGVPAVRPVAWGARRVGHFLAACFLITEEVPGAQNLTSLCSAVADERVTLAPTQRRAMVRVLAEEVRNMHLSGCSHGNLFWRNILVREGPAGDPEYFFLDAQPPHTWQRLSKNGAWWLYELAQLAVSSFPFTTRADRVRFVRYYTNHKHLTPEAKEQLHQVERLARSWQAHELRRIRMNRLFEEWTRQLQQEAAGGGPGRAAPSLSETVA